MNIYIVMGVSGCGKSTVAQALASRCAGHYLDADDFHPPANKLKLTSGIPLCDEDRWEWLNALNAELLRLSKCEKDVFLACSALREAYRTRLQQGLSNVQFIYLKGTEAVIAKRLRSRAGHFMNPALLRSQFETLEEPAHALVVEIEGTSEEVIGRALLAAGLREA
ncbi:MAG: gluconokinase [Polyangiaceae bacterium]|nr:gluconokinase [Polyangiaceae bacterium]